MVHHGGHNDLTNHKEKKPASNPKILIIQLLPYFVTEAELEPSINITCRLYLHICIDIEYNNMSTVKKAILNY